MRYKSFDKFGVNVYEKGKLTRRKTFKKLDDRIKGIEMPIEFYEWQSKKMQGKEV